MEIKAKMPGKVLMVDVKLGDLVKKGQRLLLLEAMKMETPIGCPCDGTVNEVKATAGARVNSGEVLLVIG